MIQIIKRTSGVSLDLSPNTSFEIEINQPMLDCEHIPVAFSTSITFPASKTNCEQLGYMAAMMLEPSEKEFAADIYASGVRLLGGTLSYDSIEDDELNYTFLGRDLSNDWSGKIWNQSIFQVITSTRSQNLPLILTGQVADVFAPVLINASSANEYVNQNTYKTPVEPYVKYHNDPESDTPFFTPAIHVSKILETAFSNVTVDSAINTILSQIAILGQYKPDGQYTAGGFPIDVFDVASELPDITILELAQGIAKMFCATFFRDGDGFVLKAAKDVLSSNSVKNWDEKVSDKFDSYIREGQSYKFGYSNDSDENSYDISCLDEDIETGSVATKSSYAAIIDDWTERGTCAFFAIMHSTTKDILSGKFIYAQDVSSNDSYIPAYDMLLHKVDNISSDDESEDVFDNSVDFELVRSVPDKRQTATMSDPKLFVAPIISAPAIGESRDSQVYIGVVSVQSNADGTVKVQQMTDKGVVISADSGHADISVPSLAPQDLKATWHQYFAEWVAQDRQIVSVDLNLTLQDIISFRMYDKFYFRSRHWLCNKLTLTFNAGDDFIQSAGEFISL